MFLSDPSHITQQKKTLCNMRPRILGTVYLHTNMIHFLLKRKKEKSLPATFKQTEQKSNMSYGESWLERVGDGGRELDD